MTTSTRERPPATRPGSGVAVDPRRVMAMRFRRDLTRKQLSEAVRDLGATDAHGNLVTIGRDAIGKYETGARKPSQDAMRALCAVLDCKPGEFMPGGPGVTLPPTARARQSRLAHNRALRDFAIGHGLRYKNPRTGRVYYSRKLREAYAAHMAVVLIPDSADGADLLRLRQAETAALDAAIAALALPPDAHDDAGAQEEGSEDGEGRERLVS